MRLRLILGLVMLLATAMQPALAAGTRGAASPAVVVPRKVMTWVPPYAISQAQARLPALYNNSGPRTALTHLALQFWTPTQTGGLVRATRYGTITDATIQSFVTWGHRFGIKVVLCVYNGENDWNWPLAKQGFVYYQPWFVDALIAQMQAQGLDGIDVDLEGVGTFDADKWDYVGFVKTLAARVHALNKVITVDSFPYIWNAPNQSWWAALFPFVDGINSMGYEDLGRNAPTWQNYLAQKNQAGDYSAKLQIGIPSYLASWQGSTTLQQVQWFQTAAAARVGVAIWDAQFPDAGWTSAPVWQALQAIRQN